MHPRRRARCAPIRTTRTSSSPSTCPTRRTAAMEATARTAATGRTGRTGATARTAATGRMAATGRTDPGENPGATDDTIHRSVNGGVAMTLTRPQGGISAARTRAVLATAAPGRGARHGGWTVASAALFAVLGLL